jgi:hypothetical protein
MDNKNQIKQAAKNALSTFELIAQTAATKAKNSSSANSVAFASGGNGITGADPVANLTAINASNQAGYKALMREPAISLVVYLDEDGVEHCTYISRTAQVALPDGTELAGYGSPKGRLASIPTGDEVTLNIAGRAKRYEVLKKINFKTVKGDTAWDSRDSVFIDEDGKTKTVNSLLRLLGRLKQTTPQEVLNLDDMSSLDALLAGDVGEDIIDGRRHEVRQAMALRDQPILDQFQDAIFRMPINCQLIILGPPGTGKTTTLIKRLGQKLNREHLEEPELVLLKKRANANVPYEQDWVMFTPTDLLKHFVKEAFSRELVPASDERIKTWGSHRVHLARNVFDLLQSGGKKGFVFKSDSRLILPSVIEDPIAWYESFERYHREQLTEYLRNGLSELNKQDDGSHSNLVQSLAKTVNKLTAKGLMGACLELDRLDEKLQETIKSLKEESDKLLKKSLAREYNKDNDFLTELGRYIDSLSAETDEGDDEQDDDSEEFLKAKTPIQKAQAIYNSSVRSVARSLYQKRKLSASGRPMQIAKWLDVRLPQDDILERIGHLSALQNALRRFVRFPSRIVKDVPKHYRIFRRDSFRDKLWYDEYPARQSNIDGYELDLLILATLKFTRQLLEQSWLQRRLNESGYARLNTIASQFKSQVLVDEATDFSPLQLSAMNCLSALESKSFFACGDFNQRLTSWGTRTSEQFRWACPNIENRSITTVYRQSLKLNSFAKSLLEATGGDLDLSGHTPEDMNHIGVAPTLVEGLTSIVDKALWLVKRIKEVIDAVQSNENVEQVIPSIAVLMNTEEDVSSMANALNEHLDELSLRAVACLKGQSLGEENDVRVFDVQHIKGLEFEAVFFVDVDKLADQLPELFDKYLYVGATRAATYFGVTADTTLPVRIEVIRDHFSDTFKV